MKYIIALLILASQSVLGNIRLPSVLADHMVLQQKSRVKIWGWGTPEEKVYVKPSWSTTIDSTVVDAEAKWSCFIQTPSAGGPFSIQIRGYNTIELNNVLIGEVWLCSGQSNMEMSASWGLDYKDEELGLGNKNIRFFHVPKATAAYPQDDLKASWQQSSSSVIRNFSAAACFFAQKLERELKVPVGLINASWGGSPAEIWTPSGTVFSDAILLAAAEKLKPSTYASVKPGAAYNAMIHPLISFNVAGVLWYQGETNVGQTSYAELLKAMVTSWRTAFDKEFPFYYVQIAPWSGYGKGISAAVLRESQGHIQELKGTGMVLSSDLVNDISDIHPKMKKEVGERLANYALAESYGRKGIAYKSPQFKEMKIMKGKTLIFFDNTGSGLISKSGQVKGFYIAGEDKIFVPASARIKGKTVEVWSEQVSRPVAVRFDFTSDDQTDLFNREGLPVNLFRTDNWDVPTVN